MDGNENEIVETDTLDDIPAVWILTLCPNQVSYLLTSLTVDRARLAKLLELQMHHNFRVHQLPTITFVDTCSLPKASHSNVSTPVQLEKEESDQVFSVTCIPLS